MDGYGKKFSILELVEYDRVLMSNDNGSVLILSNLYFIQFVSSNL